MFLIKMKVKNKHNRKFNLNDISVIIPTYNRAGDLKKTISSFVFSAPKLNEIIIVDQSEDNQTKQLLKRAGISKLRYFYSGTPSITIARNIGVKMASKKSSIIIFLDDDVSLERGYFDEILKIFNNFSEAKAVAGYVPSPELNKMGAFEIFLRKIFFISYPETNKARVLAPYSNTYPKKITKVINAQWLPGVNMAFKKEIFQEQKFDENLLGYAVAEDIDFCYRIYKKYPDSIFIAPEAKLIHRASNAARYHNEKISYINQIDHFYFFYKNMNRTIKERIIFIWSLFGIFFLRAVKAALSRKKTDFLKLKYFLKSLMYSIKNKDRIKKGRLREFASPS